MMETIIEIIDVISQCKSLNWCEWSRVCVARIYPSSTHQIHKKTICVLRYSSIIIYYMQKYAMKTIYQYWDFLLGEFKYWAEDAEMTETSDWNAFAAIFLLISPLRGIDLLLVKFLLNPAPRAAVQSFTLVLIFLKIFLAKASLFLLMLDDRNDIW